MKTAAIYIRVSTSDQANSLEAQESRIREYCSYHKINIHSVLVEEDISGGKPIYSRPNGAKVKELISTGKINCVISAKIDRLFRNTVDALTMVSEWNESEIALHIIDMGGLSIDTSSAAGKMCFTMLVAFAEFERGRTAERVKDVLSHKKKNLQPYSDTPYGFKVEGRVISEDGKVINPGTLVKDESQQKAIQLMKELKAKDRSLRDIALQLEARGFKSSKGGAWYPSTIKQILSNPIHEQTN